MMGEKSSSRIDAAPMRGRRRTPSLFARSARPAQAAAACEAPGKNLTIVKLRSRKPTARSHRAHAEISK